MIQNFPSLIYSQGSQSSSQFSPVPYSPKKGTITNKPKTKQIKTTKQAPLIICFRAVFSNCYLWAKYVPKFYWNTAMFINLQTVLAVLCYDGRTELLWQRLYGTQSQKYSLSGLLPKNFVAPPLEYPSQSTPTSLKV